MPPNRRTLSAACLVLASMTLPALTIHAAPSANTRATAVTVTTLAPLDRAHTFAQVREGDAVRTLLVLALSDKNITALDLSALSGLYSTDAFDVINRFSTAQLNDLASTKRGARAYAWLDLIGVGPRGLAHIAAGTNYPAHGDEVGVADAFLFPKISPAGDPRTTIVAGPGALIDYEVEVCARFDREIRSLHDFDEARKGFFVCGDFSDRATMMRKLNLKEITSGDGFPDAKSGPDRFPSGPFLVVPTDWKRFVSELVIETHVNGERRQLAAAAHMIKDLRTIVQETLDDAATRTWSYQDGRIPMVRRSAIGTDSAILTGTGDGVVFQEPDTDTVKALMGAKDRAAQIVVIERYIVSEAAKRTYLQPADRVRYSSNYLGAIDTRVIAPPRNDQ